MADNDKFTVVFKGDIRSFKQNPMTTETPWGKPYAVAVGDALEQLDERDKALERAFDFGGGTSTFNEPVAIWDGHNWQRAKGPSDKAISDFTRVCEQTGMIEQLRKE